jgi:hypothetical protein
VPSKVEHGRYYVAVHGRFTEVSNVTHSVLRSTARWQSRIGVVLVVVTLVVFIAKAFRLMSRNAMERDDVQS